MIVVNPVVSFFLLDGTSPDLSGQREAILGSMHRSLCLAPLSRDIAHNERVLSAVPNSYSFKNLSEICVFAVSAPEVEVQLYRSGFEIVVGGTRCPPGPLSRICSTTC